ncbi:Zinc finger, BED-type [Sesbania bispinosa]|nr:Zinc finger, BED-type [Sesbania bispinosa]
MVTVRGLWFRDSAMVAEKGYQQSSRPSQKRGAALVRPSRKRGATLTSSSSSFFESRPPFLVVRSPLFSVVRRRSRSASPVLPCSRPATVVRSSPVSSELDWSSELDRSSSVSSSWRVVSSLRMESETILQSVNCIDDDPRVCDEIVAPKAKSNPTEKETGDVEREGKRLKTFTSEVWKHFTKIGVKDGKEKAKCNACGQEYVIGGSKIGTSTLLRHLKKCKLIPRYQDVGGLLIDHVGKLRAREIDHKRVRETRSTSRSNKCDGRTRYGSNGYEDNEDVEKEEIVIDLTVQDSNAPETTQSTL